MCVVFFKELLPSQLWRSVCFLTLMYFSFLLIDFKGHAGGPWRGRESLAGSTAVARLVDAQPGAVSALNDSLDACRVTHGGPGLREKASSPLSLQPNPRRWPQTDPSSRTSSLGVHSVD